MSAAADWLAVLLATDAPALPVPWLMRLALTLGWALVLGLLGAALSWRLPLKCRRWVALALALWTLVPGPVSPDYWLGLAFHAPSLTGMLLCGWGLQRLLFPSGPGLVSSPQVVATGTPLHGISLFGVLWPPVALGYLLLLDTFAVLPLQLYAWGFSPMLLLGMLALSALPWLLRGGTAGRMDAGTWIAPTALLLFAATRLPTGNLWDALIDPWLWLLLQWVLIRRLMRLWRG
jgi:hypothetical protein